MTLRARPDVEHESSLARFVADPLSGTIASIVSARCLGVAARLGLFADLVDAPMHVDELANRFALQAQPLRMLLDVLVAEQYLDCERDEYTITPAGRAWLDPGVPTSVTTTLSSTLDYWDWWTELDQVAAGHAVAATTPASADEIGWARRVHTQFELARSINEEVADAVDLSLQARSILDLGSAHGGYSMALCRRNPMLRATVVDEPAAVVIGRELVWEASMERVISHREGDVFTADLGGTHDAALCLSALNWLDSELTMTLLRRLHAALRPGGLLVTMRPTSDAVDPANSDLAWYQLFGRLAAPIEPSTAAQFCEQLAGCGFGILRVRELAAAPERSIYVARAL